MLSITPGSNAQVVIDVARRGGLDSLRLAHFMAQVDWESGGFKFLEENLNYSAKRLLEIWPNRFNPVTAGKMAGKAEVIANHVYGSRLGNYLEGDGWRFRGRGFIQLTGRANYAKFAKASGHDVVGNPDLLLDPVIAAECAVWFWNERPLLDEAAERDDIESVTKIINGGLNGLPGRIERLRFWKGELLGDRKLVVTHRGKQLQVFDLAGDEEVVVRLSHNGARVWVDIRDAVK